MKTCAAVILAAGASRRLGQPKQLVRIGEETLLHRTARIALEAGFSPVLIVLGCKAEECAEAVGDLEVRTVLCPDWASGMGASLAAGARELEKVSVNSPVDSLMVLLCDQPNLAAPLLREVREVEENAEIVVTRWKDRPGPPVLFSRNFHAELQALSGEEGAQSVWKRHLTAVTFYETNGEYQDVDAPEDLTRL